MTSFDKPVRRVTRDPLSKFFGADSGRRLVVTLAQGDVIILRPHGTRHAETITAADVYRLALTHRSQCERLEKARAQKEKLEAARKDREWKKTLRDARREAATVDVD